MAYPTDDLKRLSERAFGLTFAAIFAAIVLVTWLVSHAVLGWAVVVSGCFLALALFVPWILLPLNRLWMWSTQGLGHVVNFVLLGVFFFTLVTSFAPELVHVEAQRKEALKAYFAKHDYVQVDEYLKYEVANWYFTPKKLSKPSQSSKSID